MEFEKKKKEFIHYYTDNSSVQQSHGRFGFES